MFNLSPEIVESIIAAAKRLGVHDLATPSLLQGEGLASLAVVQWNGWVIKSIKKNGSYFTTHEQLAAQVEESQRYADVATQTLFTDIGVVAHPFIAGEHPSQFQADDFKLRLYSQGRDYLRDTWKPSNWIVARDGSPILIDFLIDLNNRNWRQRHAAQTSSRIERSL